LSPTDEEGFHPHPGDPWHPGWGGEGDEDVDPFAPEPDEVEPAVEDRPKKRGLFGRRKPASRDEPGSPDDFAASDDELAEPSGWEAYDDEIVAADLESVVSEGLPAWTDEGGSSVEFESAFTVGGGTGEQDDAALPGTEPAPEGADDLDLDPLGLTDDGAVPDVSGEDPTLLLDEIVLPDLPDISGLGEAVGDAADDAADDQTGRLDALLPSPEEEAPGVGDVAPLLGDLVEETDDSAAPEAVDDGIDDDIIEIPAAADVTDLTRAAEDAAAALRSSAADLDQDEALEMVAGELDAIEIDAVPESPVIPGDLSQGLQDSLLSAGMDLADAEIPPSDPGFTPETDERDGDEAAVLPEEAAPHVAAFDDEPFRETVDPTEIASMGDVDAALSAIASEPLAAADPDALDALRSIDEDEDVDDWQAYAGGDAPEYPVPAEADGLIDDLSPPLVPAASDGDMPADESPDEPVAKRGLFGRRKARKEAEMEAEAGIEDDGWAAPEESGMAGAGVESGEIDGEDDLGTDAAEEPDAGEPGEGGLPVDGDTGGAEIGVEGDDWDDSIAGVDEADAFFGGEEQPKRRLFGRRKARESAEEAVTAAGVTDGAMEAPDALPEVEAWADADPEAIEESVVEVEQTGGAFDGPSDDAAPVEDAVFEESAVEAEQTGGVFDGPIDDAAPVEDVAFEEPLSDDPAGSPPAPLPPPLPPSAVDSGGSVVEESGHEEYLAADPAPPAPGPGAGEDDFDASSEQPLSEMPLLEDEDDRLEVTPIGDPAPAGETEELETEDGSGEWRGDGSSVPSSWFADVDEDDAEIEDLQPVDADDDTPLLEAGGMFDVGDIMDPLSAPDSDPDADPDAGPGLSLVDEQSTPDAAPAGFDESAYEPPVVAAVEPPDLFDSAGPVAEEPSGPPDDGSEAPDLLGAAAALMPDEAPAGSEPQLWGETMEMDAVDVSEPPSLPGAGAEAWDAPPLVPGGEQEWEAEAVPAGRDDTHPEPPIDPDAEVYDVVEDDLDRAPAPDPQAIGPDEPVEWTEDIYTGAVTTEHRGLAEAVARASTEDTQLQALSAAMPGLETGVVGFEDVEDLGTDEIYIPPVRSDFGARVLTGLILVSLLFGSLWVGGAALAAFIGVMVMIGLTEYFTTLRHKGYSPLVIFGYLGAVGALAGTWVWGPIAVPGAILSTIVVVFFFYAFAPRRRDVLVNGGLTVMGMAWITGTVAFAMPIIASEDYRVLIFALVAATVAMDVGAYGFGRAWGSAQMAPVLSPNKSIEGLAGGVVLSIGVAIGIGFFLEPFDIQSGAALGLVVAITAPLGDLAESMFKRSLGVKDMGAILPGHGGIMDRVDAFLFVIPPVWVLYELLGYLN